MVGLIKACSCFCWGFNCVTVVVYKLLKLLAVPSTWIPVFAILRILPCVERAAFFKSLGCHLVSLKQPRVCESPASVTQHHESFLRTPFSHLNISLIWHAVFFVGTLVKTVLSTAWILWLFIQRVNMDSRFPSWLKIDLNWYAQYTWIPGSSESISDSLTAIINLDRTSNGHSNICILSNPITEITANSQAVLCYPRITR